MRDDKTIAVVGLGYVGLPLALAFGKRFNTIGFDLNPRKIESYKQGRPLRDEAEAEDFQKASQLTITGDPAALAKADFVIVAVPTPISLAKRPDLALLKGASEIIGRNLKPGAIIVFESTVYPGVTEEICGPIIEHASGRKRGRDFYLGYSPERINPGDREHTLERIVKVVAGENAETLEAIAELYASIVPAGVHRVSSIRVAEAAKVIENTQRDLNIALVNELAIIFDKLGLDTTEVLAAAGTKWNFLPFRPGLVGGHCIGVDPYYLTYRAEVAGYNPQIILAGRRINDSMGKYVARQTIKKLAQAGRPVTGATVLVLGLAFKEDCADIRNSRVADLIAELDSYGVKTLVCDPLADAEEAHAEYGVTLTEFDRIPKVDAIVVAVAHEQFKTMNIELLAARKAADAIPFMDVKSAFNRELLERHGFRVWRL